MVHWPEVMFTYEQRSGMLFSADAFGSFGGFNGAIFSDEDDYREVHLEETRRYYTNIVGKYGPQVQTAMKKAGALDLRMICPLHGPILRGMTWRWCFRSTTCGAAMSRRKRAC